MKRAIVIEEVFELIVRTLKKAVRAVGLVRQRGKSKKQVKENHEAKFLAAFKIVEDKWVQFAGHYPEAVGIIRKDVGLNLQFIQIGHQIHSGPSIRLPEEKKHFANFYVALKLARTKLGEKEIKALTLSATEIKALDKLIESYAHLAK